MRSTTIKVSTELRDRLAERAKAEGTTLAGAIERSLDDNDEAQFWAAVAATMGGAAITGGAATTGGAGATSVAELQAAAERDSATLMDGLDPDEDWSDIL